MKKLCCLFVLALLFQAVPARADYITFGDLSGASVGSYIDGTYDATGLVPGSQSYMHEGQTLIFWSGHPANTQHSYGWRLDRQPHFGMYIDFDAGKGGSYYEAGITFAIPVMELSFEYVKGNEYLVAFLYADGSTSTVALGNTNSNGSSGWGNLYNAGTKGGITEVTFFYDKRAGDKSNAQYLGLLSMGFNTFSTKRQLPPATPTPLPATFWLMGMGMAAYGAHLRRQKAKKA